MKIIDLTHVVSADMPVYPGTEQPVFITGCSIEENGFLEKKITMYSHTGTHVDAPAHLIKNHKTLDLLPINHFYGPALRLGFEDLVSDVIDVADLEPYSKDLNEVEFLLIHTGWSKHWGSEKYYSDYSVLSLKAANWLSTFKLKGVGFDTISADRADSQDYPVHKTFLQKDIIIIENLKNLLSLPGSIFNFSCFPIKFQDADGSPVRAVAYI
jgi:kynurenine formamidase